MITIIEQGKKPKEINLKIIRCYNCKTKFSYQPIDVKSSPRNESYVECPTCKQYLDDSDGEPA